MDGDKKTLKDVYDKINAKNAQNIEKELLVPDVLYLELSLCKDYVLGFIFQDLMSSDKTGAEKERIYAKVVDKIPVYQDRLFDEIESILPDIGYTDAQIEKGLRDPDLASRIFKYSPNTFFYATIHSDLVVNANHSQVAEKYVRVGISDKEFYRMYDRILFIVNTFPLKLNLTDEKILASYFTSRFGVDVSVVCRDPAQVEMSDLWLNGVDLMYINDINRWTDNPYITEKLAETMAYYERNTKDVLHLPDPAKNPALFAKKKLYARKRFSTIARDRLQGHNLDHMFAIGTSGLNLSTHFDWIPFAFTRLVEVDTEKAEKGAKT